MLERIRSGTMPPMVGTGATFGAAAAEWLGHVEHDRTTPSASLLAHPQPSLRKD
jgi:hypothetical protein